MQVQLLKRKQVTVKGEPRNLQPGDWADVGRQTAMRWIAEGIAKAPHLPRAGLLPFGCGVWSIGTTGQGVLSQIQADYQIDGVQAPLSAELPYLRTLIWNPEMKLRTDLLIAGYNLLNVWQVAVPLFDYDTLAQSIGTPEARDRTLAYTHDLRIPVPNPVLVFVRRCKTTTRFMEAWLEERETGDDDRLCFLRAWCRVKPLVNPLPYTWGLAKDEDKYDQQR